MAAGLVPELIGLFGGRRAGEMAGEVAGVVREVTGTADPAAAARAIEADPAAATRLRVRLKGIKQRCVEPQAQEAQAERQALLDTVRAEMGDRARARGAMVSAVGIRDWAGRTVALGPPVVSVIVLLGFFAFTVWLVRDPPQDATETTDTLLNVVVGALVAGFTAVIKFWLGSSQGSYRANYWNTVRCDDLPRGVDLAVFSFGVNAGPAAAVKRLQRAIGAERDGAVGPLTLRAVWAGGGARALVEALATARLGFCRRLESHATFGKGWESRVAEVRKQALPMAAA